MMNYYFNSYKNPYAILWYKKLDIHQKIYVKTSFVLLCGMKFEDVLQMFNLLEVISMYYNKLVMEGVI